MKTFKLIFAVSVLTGLASSWMLSMASGQEYMTQDEQNKKVLKQAVVGAGTGAVASGASGGSAGKGALIGAGTSVIGNALVDTLTAAPQSPPPQVQVQTSERGYVDQRSGYPAQRERTTTDNNLIWGVLMVVVLAVVGMVLYFVVGQKRAQA